jgi:hypothetical protein
MRDGRILLKTANHFVIIEGPSGTIGTTGKEKTTEICHAIDWALVDACD